MSGRTFRSQGVLSGRCVGIGPVPSGAGRPPSVPELLLSGPAQLVPEWCRCVLSSDLAPLGVEIAVERGRGERA